MGSAACSPTTWASARPCSASRSCSTCADARRRPHAPFLVVAPTSVVSNWVAEAARFTPGLVVPHVPATEARRRPGRRARRGRRHRRDELRAAAARRRRVPAVGRSGGWAGLVLDEAQIVKNPASRIHRCVRDLQAPVQARRHGHAARELAHRAAGAVRHRRAGAVPLRAPVRRGVRAADRAAGGRHPRGAGAGDAPAVTAGLRAERLAGCGAGSARSCCAARRSWSPPNCRAKQEQVLAVDLAPEHRALYDVWLQRERQKLLRAARGPEPQPVHRLPLADAAAAARAWTRR